MIQLADRYEGGPPGQSPGIPSVSFQRKAQP
jgi:hypothetical protein